MMDRCAARYGEIFTLRIRRGRPWVLLSNPAHVKQVFTADSALMGAGAGEANPLLGPLLGSRSVMLLDEPQHMGDRKRLLPSFHGRRMRDYGALMTDIAERQIAGWPTGEPFELWPRMQSISLDVVISAVFDGLDDDRRELLRRAARSDDRLDQRPAAAGAAGGDRRALDHGQRGSSREVMRRSRVGRARRGPRAARAGPCRGRRRRRGRGRHPRDAGARIRLRTGRHERAEDARRTRDDALRRADGDLAGVGLRAACCATLQKLARLREEVLRGESDEYLDARRQGDAAPLPRRAARDAPARRADADRRLHAARRERSSHRAST